MSYLDLVEEHPKELELTQFEKIMVAAKRAKDVHDRHKTPLLRSIHKAPYLALEELQAERINPAYKEEEEPAAALPISDDGEDGDDE